MVEWSITIDCKSIALRASLVQIQPGAHENLIATVNTVAIRFLLCIEEMDLNRRLVNRAGRRLPQPHTPRVILLNDERV
mgnify:FL=1